MLNVMLKAILYSLEKNVMLSCDFYRDEMRKDTNGYTLTREVLKQPCDLNYKKTNE